MEQKPPRFRQFSLGLSLWALQPLRRHKRWTRHQALSAQQQRMIPIAAFTANRADMDKLDNSVCDAGLEAGLTVHEIKEILVQMYAYAGFPAQSQRYQHVYGRDGRAASKRYQKMSMGTDARSRARRT